MAEGSWQWDGRRLEQWEEGGGWAVGQKEGRSVGGVWGSASSVGHWTEGDAMIA